MVGENGLPSINCSRNRTVYWLKWTDARAIWIMCNLSYWQKCGAICFGNWIWLCPIALHSVVRYALAGGLSGLVERYLVCRAVPSGNYFWQRGLRGATSPLWIAKWPKSPEVGATIQYARPSWSLHHAVTGMTLPALERKNQPVTGMTWTTRRQTCKMWKIRHF